MSAAAADSIRTVDDVNYVNSSGQAVNGQLLYNYKCELLFISAEAGEGREELVLPLQLVLELELGKGASAEQQRPGANPLQRISLFVRLKWQWRCRFDVSSKWLESVSQLVSLVEEDRRRQPAGLSQFVAGLPAQSPLANRGLYKFNMEAEFIRLGAVNNANWQLWTANSDYAVCDTYPPVLYVPARLSDQVLLECARFRSRGRLPALTYFYESRQSALCRCSQPLVGLNARSATDEQVVQAICDANPNPEAKHLYVVDTRPMANAIGNRAMGKGYEMAENYKNIHFSFFHIDNIHVMRDSQRQLALACEEAAGLSAGAWAARVAKSAWLRHLRSILLTAGFAAAKLAEGSSVLVHCSDGWDRTAQTCALAQMLLDPHYRCLHGFQDLIEKEWLSFGHKFSDRCGHFGWSDEASPVFAQFVDCVWQLTQMFPEKFEFNEAYLVALVDAAYSCEFATFMGNSHRERSSSGVGDRLPSFWVRALERRPVYVNPLYDPADSGAISLGPLPRHLLQVWLGFYCRWDRTDSLQRLLLQSRDRADCLQDHARCLRARLQADEPAANRSQAGGQLCTDWLAESALRRRRQCQQCQRPFYRLTPRLHCHGCGRLLCADCCQLSDLRLDGQHRRQATPLCAPCAKDCRRQL